MRNKNHSSPTPPHWPSSAPSASTPPMAQGAGERRGADSSSPLHAASVAVSSSGGKLLTVLPCCTVTFPQVLLSSTAFSNWPGSLLRAVILPAMLKHESPSSHSLLLEQPLALLWGPPGALDAILLHHCSLWAAGPHAAIPPKAAGNGSSLLDSARSHSSLKQKCPNPNRLFPLVQQAAVGLTWSWVRFSALLTEVTPAAPSSVTPPLTQTQCSRAW